MSLKRKSVASLFTSTWLSEKNPKEYNSEDMSIGFSPSLLLFLLVAYVKSQGRVTIDEYILSIQDTLREF